MIPIVCALITLYQLAIFGVIILSWFPASPGSGLGAVYDFLRRITDPVLMPVRQMLPSIGGGGMRIDLSPLIVVLILQLLRSLICG